MPKFTLLAGKHASDKRDPVTNDFKVYVKGDIVESDNALDKMFANKFRKLTKDDSPVKKEAIIPKPAEKLKKKPKQDAAEINADEEENFSEVDDEDESRIDDEPEDEAPPETYGLEITSNIPLAKKKGLKVFDKEGVFTIFSEDRPEEPIRKNIDGKAAAVKFMKEY